MYLPLPGTVDAKPQRACRCPCRDRRSTRRRRPRRAAAVLGRARAERALARSSAAARRSRLSNHDESATSSRLVALRASPLTSIESAARHPARTPSCRPGPTRTARRTRRARSATRAGSFVRRVRVGMRTETGCVSVSTTHRRAQRKRPGAARARGRSRQATSASLRHQNPFREPKLSRTDVMPAPCSKRLGSDTEQDLEARIALADRGHAESPRQPELVAREVVEVARRTRCRRRTAPGRRATSRPASCSRPARPIALRPVIQPATKPGIRPPPSVGELVERHDTAAQRIGVVDRDLHLHRALAALRDRPRRRTTAPYLIHAAIVRARRSPSRHADRGSRRSRSPGAAAACRAQLGALIERGVVDAVARGHRERAVGDPRIERGIAAAVAGAIRRSCGSRRQDERRLALDSLLEREPGIEALEPVARACRGRDIGPGAEEQEIGLALEFDARGERRCRRRSRSARSSAVALIQSVPHVAACRRIELPVAHASSPREVHADAGQEAEVEQRGRRDHEVVVRAEREQVRRPRSPSDGARPP